MRGLVCVYQRIRDVTSRENRLITIFALELLFPSFKTVVDYFLYQYKDLIWNLLANLYRSTYSFMKCRVIVEGY